jgi:thiamine biosynthesis lipoprotein
MGTTCRVVVTAPDADERVAAVERLVHDYDARLSRFRPDSELCALNAAPEAEVAVSPLLADAVRAALWAAERTGGLVDPTLLDQLEAAGYTRSRRREEGAGVPLPATTPRAGHPHPAARWRTIAVDGDRVRRPPGLRLDLGGTGKGHVADLAARILDGAAQWCIDCGGDLRVGGTPQAVHVAHPLDGTIAATWTVDHGAVATSAIHARAWLGPDGRPRHHLLDPATGEPAWTGLVAATATAPTVLEAETLAKLTLLSGDPAHLLHGGLLVTEDGSTTTVRETAPRSGGQPR